MLRRYDALLGPMVCRVWGDGVVTTFFVGLILSMVIVVA
jgi:hypothetical protein